MAHVLEHSGMRNQRLGPQGEVGGERLRYPRLKGVCTVIPLADGRLVFQLGTALEPILIMDDRDPPGLVRDTVCALDGSRSWDSIVQSATGDGLRQMVDRTLRELVSAGALEEGAFDVDPQMPDHEVARYSRNLNCWSALSHPTLSKYAIQRSLGEQRVLLLGMGGMGSNVALALAMLGVGHLVLVDFDEVELQNLNRQVLYSLDDVGEVKVHRAKRRLSAINPAVRIETIATRVETVPEAVSLLRDYQPQILVLGADRPVFRIDRIVNEACVRCHIPYVSGSITGTYGLVWARIPGDTACEECFVASMREHNPTRYATMQKRHDEDLIPATSALPFGVQVVSGLIGFNVMQFLLGVRMDAADALLHVEFFGPTLSRRVTRRLLDCRLCGSS